MDISIVRNIYGKAWLIQPAAALQMLDLWERTVTNKDLTWEYKPEGRHKFFESNGKAIVAPDNTWALRDFAGFDGASVAVIPISGPIMKNDYCGALGTSTIKVLTALADNTESVQAIVYLIDSPGGTVDGTEALANAIKSCNKETIALCDNMMCSAAYWLGSACDKVFASAKTNMIGCIGTMVSWYDNTAALESKGIVLREYYATDSKDKNAAFIEANKGDGKKLIAELLNPLNDIFLNSVKEGRGSKLNEDALTGKDYTAEEAMAMGLIDGIKTLDEIVGTFKKFQNTTQTTIMTAAEFKVAHPEAYNEILGIGAANEQARIAGWKAWEATDADAVAAGIASGKEITQNDVSTFSAKAVAKATAATLEKDNPEKVETTPAADPGDEQATEQEANMQNVLAAMGIKKK